MVVDQLNGSFCKMFGGREDRGFSNMFRIATDWVLKFHLQRSHSNTRDLFKHVTFVGINGECLEACSFYCLGPHRKKEMRACLKMLNKKTK